MTAAGKAVQSRRASGPSTRSVPVLASGRGRAARQMAALPAGYRGGR
jgi:hypothetical protein